MKKSLLSLMLALMALQVSAQSYHYDVNNDKKVNVTDIMLIVNKILGNTTEPEEHPLTITVSENPLIQSDGSGSQQASRRSPEVTTESLKGNFFVSWMYNITDETGETSYYYPTSTGNVYDTKPNQPKGYYETNQTWPSDLQSGAEADIKLTVFGFNAGSFVINEDNVGYPYLQIGTDESSDFQGDMIVAKNAKTWNESNGNVPLEFNHVCSAFLFYIMKSEGMADYSIDVSKVVLHNIKKQGRYYLMSESDKWNFDHENPANLYTNYTLKEFESSDYMPISDTKSLLNPNDKDYLFIIPQNISSMKKGTSIETADNDKQSYIEISCSITKGDKRWPASGFGSVYLPFNPTFENTELKMKPGYIYPIIINVGTSIRDAEGNKISLQ